MLCVYVKNMQVCPYSTKIANLINVYNYMSLIKLHIPTLQKSCISYLCGTMGPL